MSDKFDYYNRLLVFIGTNEIVFFLFRGKKSGVFLFCLMDEL